VAGVAKDFALPAGCDSIQLPSEAIRNHHAYQLKLYAALLTVPWPHHTCYDDWIFMVMSKSVGDRRQVK
jgi:hypothetical protein